MDDLSYTETSVLSALSVLKDDADIDHITNLLLEMGDLQEENRLFSLLHKLKNLKRLEIKKIKLFNKFLVNNVVINNCVDFSGTDFIPKKDISIFIKKIISSFKINKKKPSKYEVRFFWTSDLYPEVYDFNGLIFNEKYYTHSLTTDKYIVTNNNNNIKIRKNEIQIKTCMETINNISQYIKKKKLSFPVKIKKINDFLNQKIASDSSVFNTVEDLITNLSHFPETTCVDVLKERYVRKMEGHIKIEMSLIKIQQKEWKTICIESKALQKVVALSLLINQENAEILSYNEFLRKYGTIDLK